jgi:TusA-related sulfurtransferase
MMHEVDKDLDARGYNCPIPVLMAKKALSSMLPGQILRIRTTDAGAEIDFRVFAEASGNQIIELEVINGLTAIIMEKRSA